MLKMTVKLLVFALSLILFCGFIYIITGLWFRGKRNDRLKVFSALGLLYSLWLLTAGINILLSDELFAIIFPLLPQSLVCIVPTVLLIHILYFTESKYAADMRVILILSATTTVDLLLLWTNPFHKEFITGYDGDTPLTVLLFPVHAVLTYIPVILSVFLLYKYIIGNIKQKPFLGLVGIGTAIPVVLNVLYSFQIFDIGFDLTPFAFIIMYGTFTMYSIQMRLFDIKETAAEEIFDSLSEALMVVDRTGLVTNVNPAFKKAFPDISITFDKTPVSDVADYLRPISTNPDSPDLYENFFSDEPEDISGMEITVSKGELHNYLLSKDIISESGYYMGYIVTLADISSYRRMIDTITELKSQADSASSAKGLFLSHMSHEIRTPLNAIIGMIKIGLDTGDIEKKNYCFARADSASKHLLGLINDILDISKIEADKFELSYGELNFGRMLDNITNVTSIRVEEKKQTLIVNLSEDVPVCLEGDELRLSQVITNLLSNAIKFTPENGTISLDVNKTADTGGGVELRVEVTDTGIGISEDQQARLFSSFSQADASISTKFGGTGLGLAISKSIVELMGGRIWVESELGKGSKFIFTIKAAILKGSLCEAAEAVEYEENMRRYDFSSHIVLVAEDIEINREILSAILEETNVSLDYAENGKVALDMFCENPYKYSLILMDVSMPVMDGYESARAIRASGLQNAKEIPIIAMTANVFKEDIERCLESGMNDHTGKPVDSSALFGLLRNYMTRYSEARIMKNVHSLDHGIAWDEGLLTGNAIVDMQHQKMYERLSDLADSCEDGSDTDKLYDTLMFLLNRTIRHFTDEEALQLEYSYPDYENHRKKHEEFKETVSELVKRFEERGSSDQLSKDVNRIIVRWMVNHIQQEDRKFSEHVRTTTAALDALR